MKVTEAMLNSIDRLTTEWSAVTINDMNDDFIYMNICDKVDIGAILPSGRVLTNKDDNGFRSKNLVRLLTLEAILIQRMV